MKRMLLLALGGAALLAAAPWITPGQAQAQAGRIADVFVTNLPETQEVRGEVAVRGTVDHHAFARKEGILVPNSARADLSQLTYAGDLDAAGFTEVTLSLQGEVKSSAFGPGTVGAFLLPAEEPVHRALRDTGQVHFPVECVSQVVRGGPSTFSAPQVHQEVAFPKYRIYLYNTLDKTVEANLYIYLGN